MHPDIIALIRRGIHGGSWCNRRHRYHMRIRRTSHSGLWKNLFFRTAPELAAYHNALCRGVLNDPVRSISFNDFDELFRGHKNWEGPDGTGHRILMIEQPFCFARIPVAIDEEQDPGWLKRSDWFVDPESGEPSRIKLVFQNDEWSWARESLGLVIWRDFLKRPGEPLYRNGDPMDCSERNLWDGTPGAIPASQDITFMHPLAFQMVERLRAFVRCIETVSAEELVRMDPWCSGVLYEDRRWLVDLAVRFVPEIFERSTEWAERRSLIRSLSRPWLIQWKD